MVSAGSRVKKNGRGRKQPILDLRNTGQVSIAQPKPVVLTEKAWRLLGTRCRELNDDEFRVIRIYKRGIEFSLTDHDGKSQQYCIRAEPLKRVKRTTGKSLVALFLIFEQDGHSVIDTAQYWFEPFKPWLKYWSGKGVHPKHLKQELTSVSSDVSISKQIQRYKKFLER